VYTSWKKDGVLKLHDAVGLLPAFTTPELTTRELAPLDQIQSVHTIMHELFPTMDPPFKIQFKREGGDDWCDIAFSDQVRIAAVMFFMKKTKSTEERRMVHYNRFLIAISLDTDVYKFEITEFDGSKHKVLASRLIVTDGNFDFSS
jgi:hypothetical protein